MLKVQQKLLCKFILAISEQRYLLLLPQCLGQDKINYLCMQGETREHLSQSLLHFRSLPVNGV